VCWSTSKRGGLQYHAFWADSDADESRIWSELLTILAAYPGAPLYHYGQYEARAMRALAKRHQSASEALVERLVNLNAYVYGKVYFPVRSVEGHRALAGRRLAHRRCIRRRRRRMAPSLG